MTAVGHDTLSTRTTLQVGGRSYAYYSLSKAAEQLGDVSRLPFSMKVLLENLLRFEDGVTVTREDIQAIVDWLGDKGATSKEIQYRPARVLMQDFTGVPASSISPRCAMRSPGSAAIRPGSIRRCRSTSSSTIA
jgi:aconitate hydratase